MKPTHSLRASSTKEQSAATASKKYKNTSCRLRAYSRAQRAEETCVATVSKQYKNTSSKL